MDLIEEILTSRYRFSRKPNLPKILKTANIGGSHDSVQGGESPLGCPSNTIFFSHQINKKPQAKCSEKSMPFCVCIDVKFLVVIGQSLTKWDRLGSFDCKTYINESVRF